MLFEVQIRADLTAMRWVSFVGSHTDLSRRSRQAPSLRCSVTMGDGGFAGILGNRPGFVAMMMCRRVASCDAHP